MKATLKPGLTHRLAYKVTENKTVPYTLSGVARDCVPAEGFCHRLHDRADGVGVRRLLPPHLDSGGELEPLLLQCDELGKWFGR